MSAFSRKYGSYVVTPIAVAALLTAGAVAQSSNGNAGAGPMRADNRAEMQMSHEAMRIFNDAGMAVTALNNGNKAGAEHDITMAMTTRDRLAMTARSHQLAKVVPIYSEIDQSTALGTILAAKNNGQAVPPAKEPVTVDNVKDQFTFVGVDLDKTKARLKSAQEAIQNNNVQAAKDTLNAIGDDLVVAKVSADAPLLAIRENLALAHMAAASSHPREATAALQQASGELAAYAQNGGGPHGQQAMQLRGSIDQMLGGSGQKKAMSAGEIGQWWTEVNGWMQTQAD